MTITFTWKIESLEYQLNYMGLENVVSKIVWHLIGTDENGVYSGRSSIQMLNLESVDPNQFIPYSDLTEEVVVGWLQSSIGSENVQNLYTSISESIAIKNAPKTVETSVPPWVA